MQWPIPSVLFCERYRDTYIYIYIYIYNNKQLISHFCRCKLMSLISIVRRAQVQRQALIPAHARTVYLSEISDSNTTNCFDKWMLLTYLLYTDPRKSITLHVSWICIIKKWNIIVTAMHVYFRVTSTLLSVDLTSCMTMLSRIIELTDQKCIII